MSDLSTEMTSEKYSSEEIDGEISDSEKVPEVDATSKPTHAKKPSLTHLKSLVQSVIAQSCWWERHGIDLWILVTGLWLVPVGFLIIRGTSSAIGFLVGLFLLGYAHMMFITKGAHLTAHGALGLPERWNKMAMIFFSEVCGGFSSEEGLRIHIQFHHPYTNIIGLGDSSTWKVPSLNRIMYLFVAPHLLPILAPLYSAAALWPQWKSVVKFVLFSTTGLVGQYYAIVLLANLSPGWALFCLFFSRAMLQCSYIHVNIFQHIGLKFYELSNKPDRLEQMATGALNLKENFFLDFCFGQSLISCHVEHHLFPKLSDHMCLKVKPLVSSYLKSYNLPYNEDSYMSRLSDFYHRYEELMVHAPPITKFIGVQ